VLILVGVHGGGVDIAQNWAAHFVPWTKVAKGWPQHERDRSVQRSRCYYKGTGRSGIKTTPLIPYGEEPWQPQSRLSSERLLAVLKALGHFRHRV
jgi:hypothetical protein